MTAQELIEMTPEQQRAFNRMRKAVKDFKKAGGRFYTVLDSIHGLNGNYVSDITSPADIEQGEFGTESVFIPSVSNAGFSGFADDTHMIKLTDEGLALLNEEE
ncbi:hypothetical protein [Proteus cibi]|uniref:hypothetical protein n=1 Tax=Proteus cibi TaxID=2050966 RepID=UPI000D6937C1|nr:hypothetical protein [Proteus cibi]